MRELIDRRELSKACYKIYEEVVREGKNMTAQEVKALMLRFEHEIKTAPTVATATAGFETCEHYPRQRHGTGCALLTERVCAVKGKCSFFTPRAETPPPPMPLFSDSIKKARLAVGLSTMQLAAAVGVSRQTVNEWERGVVGPSPENRAKLAAALGMTAEELENFY